MKKTIHTFCAIVIVLSILFVPFNTAQASSSNGPTVTSLSGDQEFSVTVKDPASLEGMTASSGGLIVPAGFPLGEKQFSGNAVVVSGLSYGSVQVCFPFRENAYGWTGDIYQWLSGKWTKLETTIIPGQESDPATACATTYSDGTYALITGYTSKAAEYEPCRDISITGWGITATAIPTNRVYIDFIILKSNLPIGTVLKYQFLNVLPSNIWTGKLYGTGVITGVFNVADGTQILTVGPNDRITFSDIYHVWPSHFVLRVYVGNCYADFNYGNFGPTGL